MEAPSQIEDKKQKSKSNPLTFKSFMKVPKIVFNVIGLIFWPRTSYWDYKWWMVNFVFSLISINVAIICEFIYEVEFFRHSDNMIEGTELNIYMIYSILSEIKVLCVFKNLSKINDLIKMLNDIFPVTAGQIKTYNLHSYQRMVMILTVPVTLIMWLNVCYSYWISLYTYFCLFDHDNENLGNILPYYFWYPFKINTVSRYAAAVLQQCHASQMVTLCVVGCDALLTCVLLQICMHLDVLSTRLRERHNNKGDIRDLSVIVRYHDKILQMMNDVNECFSGPVFLTFVSSSFVMCFVGFLVINGTSKLATIKFAFFLVYELMKVFQISLLGNMLMESSLNIGNTAYNINWYENTVQYQKVIQILIFRTQKPANLNAITLHEVDLTCFKEIVSKAYTFFTLLHTMYNT